ncbi:MAG: hypothetical protein FJ207_13065 [Gemmatimonadetes bacterium]|nr:hypothetical protein [Gemmatimonadota bacterium]
MLAVLAFPAAPQGKNAGSGMRLGVSYGGISTFGVMAEWFDDTHAVELAVGTWSFHEVSVSAVYKEYFFGSRVRPFVGGGLWVVAAFPPQERTGLALVLRAPVGAEWSFVDDHSVGVALNVNRALAVRRTDPDDDLPLVGRIVPLPEIYYRLTP